MEYTLKTSHALKLLKIAKKLNISKKLKNIRNSADGLEGEQRFEQLGFEIILTIAENLTDVENEICELLADIEGKSIVEIKNQDLFLTLETIKSVFTDSRVLSFFTGKVKA